jgi:hypothetical protein
MKLLIALILTVVLFSCSSPRYVNSPAAYNATFFKEQGDLKVSASGSINPTRIGQNIDGADSDGERNYATGLDGQVAYAITKNFLITAGGMYRNETDRFDEDELNSSNTESKVKYKRYMVDAGVGFYLPMGRSKRHYFNIIAGAGFGKSRHTDYGIPDSRIRNYEADVAKFYLQPAFNFSFSEQFRMSLSPKISGFTFNNIKTNYDPAEESTLELDGVRGRTMMVFEPSLFFQVGFKNADWIKLDIGMNFSTPPFYLNVNDDGGPNLYSRGFLFSLGTSFYPFAGRNK